MARMDWFDLSGTTASQNTDVTTSLSSLPDSGGGTKLQMSLDSHGHLPLDNPPARVFPYATKKKIKRYFTNFKTLALHDIKLFSRDLTQSPIKRHYIPLICLTIRPGCTARGHG